MAASQDRDEALRRERAVARTCRITIRHAALGEAEPPVVRGAAAIELAVELTRAAFALGGIGFARLARADMPYAFVPRNSTRV